MIIRQPIELIGATGKHDISAKVDGGGLTGQAGAVRLGIARALIKMDADLRGKLKKEGFLTRDPRETERKNTASKAQGNVSSSRRDNLLLGAEALVIYICGPFSGRAFSFLRGDYEHDKK